MKERPSYELALRGLHGGVPIQLGNVEYVMVKAGDTIQAPSGDYVADHDVVCMVLHERDPKTKEFVRKYTVPADLTLNGFIDMCTMLTEDERFDIAASLTLRALNVPKER